MVFCCFFLKYINLLSIKTIFNSVQVICPSGWTLFNFKCYQFPALTTDGITAKSICNKLGGYLAVPSDDAEVQYFITMFNSIGIFWVGINDHYIGQYL